MHVIKVRNPHEGLYCGLSYLKDHGVTRGSRNGTVLVSPVPVTTVYEFPDERMVFWPLRDANPFLHIYEALWMLAGREDIQFLKSYAKNIANYSDNGVTLHGAYGYRWRTHFGFDQLSVIVDRLSKDPTDRRCVLQMWSATDDLGKEGKDFPCNTMATFQVDTEGRLNLTVFCRSNDIIWGTYGANAVHFSVLLSYMACLLGIPVGTYTQVSVNYHAYFDVYEKTVPLLDEKVTQPYRKDVFPTKFPTCSTEFNTRLQDLLTTVDLGFLPSFTRYTPDGTNPFLDCAYHILRAYNISRYKGADGKLQYEDAIGYLSIYADYSNDMVTAAREWLERRRIKANGD